MTFTENPQGEATRLVERMFAAEFAFMKSGGEDRGLLERGHARPVAGEGRAAPQRGGFTIHAHDEAVGIAGGMPQAAAEAGEGD